MGGRREDLFGLMFVPQTDHLRRYRLGKLSTSARNATKTSAISTPICLFVEEFTPPTLGCHFRQIGFGLHLAIAMDQIFPGEPLHLRLVVGLAVARAFG